MCALHQQQQQQANVGPTYTTKVLHAYHAPVSPHVAAAAEGRVVTDHQLVSDTRQALAAFMAQLSVSNGGHGIAVVETAGGVASPGPSGSLQVGKGVLWSVLFTAWPLVLVMLSCCRHALVAFSQE